MKSLLIQSSFLLLIAIFVWGVCYIFPNAIGWNYPFLIIAGYLIFIIITSKWNWIVTILQFLIIGFLSFMIIGFLFNKVYEPIIELHYPNLEGEIGVLIGFVELAIIKFCSDYLLLIAPLKIKTSLVEKMRLLEK
jgi:hypothetical protein